MSYSEFTLPRVQADFSIKVETYADLFGEVPRVPLDPAFQAILSKQVKLGLAANTEKARSEWLIAPVLAELWRRTDERVSILSDVEFNVEPEAGLVGCCDFLLGRGPQLPFVTAPVLAIVEAKNQSIAGGLGQCAAELVAVHRFNQREGTPRDTVYGVVTSGSNWKFMRLRPPVLAIDVNEYLIAQVDQILGILLYMVDLPPAPATAA